MGFNFALAAAYEPWEHRTPGTLKPVNIKPRNIKPLKPWNLGTLT